MRERAAGHPPRRLAAFGVMAVAVAGILLPNAPAIKHIPGRDSGIYLYMGQLVLQGGLPYRDGWDHKPPGMYYINALGLWLGGGSWWGVWGLELLTILGAAWIGWRMLRRAFGETAAWFGTGAWLLALPILLEGGNLTEEYALGFQFAILALCASGEARRRYGWRSPAIGAATAAAFLLRQNLVGAGVTVALYLTLRVALRRQPLEALRALAGMVAGFLAVVAGVAAYFAAHQALRDLWDQAFRFNLVYSGVGPGVRLRAFAEALRVTSPAGVPLIATAAWLLGGWRLVVERACPQPQRALVGLALIGWPVDLLLANTSGRWYAHYFMAWLPSYAILAAFFATQLAPAGGSLRPLVGGKAALAAWLLALAVQPAGRTWYQATAARDPLREQAVAYVRQATRAADFVLVWGNEPLVNFLARRTCPSRFFEQYALYQPGYQRPELVETFLRDLAQRPPRLIIDASAGNAIAPPLDRAARASWLARRAHPLLPEMQQVFDYLTRHYDPAEALGEWTVYRRKDARG